MPEGWRWERLGTVSTEPLRGPPASRFTETFRYLDVSSIEGAQIAPKCIKSKQAPSRARQFVEAGDTLLSGVRVYLRNIAMVPDDQVDVASTAFCVLRPGPDLDARFMHRWISSDWFINALIPLQRGNSPPAVLDADVRDQPIPVPPLDVQRAISARIDALFAEIDEGEAALARARAGVETYRKALLKAAVTGELTADWRAEQAASGRPQETGEQLLARILADRRARWHADPKNARKTYTEPAGPDTEGLPELPEGWTWASLGQLVSGIEAGLNVKAHGRPPVHGETGIVKVSAVTWDEFDEDQSKALFSDAQINERDLIAVGDFLISRANTLELVGAPAIVRRLSSRLVLSDKILRLIVPEDFKDWLYFVLKSPLGRYHIETRSTGNQLSMRNISQDGLRALPIPIPPRDELSEALRMVIAGWHEHQFLSAWLAGGNTASTLRQSILAAAFRGELAA